MSEAANNSRVILAEHMDSVNKNRAKLQALTNGNPSEKQKMFNALKNVRMEYLAYSTKTGECK